jgi:hypothetical protein
MNHCHERHVIARSKVGGGVAFYCVVKAWRSADMSGSGRIYSSEKKKSLGVYFRRAFLWQKCNIYFHVTFTLPRCAWCCIIKENRVRYLWSPRYCEQTLVCHGHWSSTLVWCYRKHGVTSKSSQNHCEILVVKRIKRKPELRNKMRSLEDTHFIARKSLYQFY